MPVLVLCLCGSGLLAQDVTLLTPAYQYSKQKTAYLTLKSGKEIVGNVKDFDRKRGVIDYIKIETENGKVLRLEASKIKSAYLHPTALSSMNSFFDDLAVQRWGKELHEERFTDGYVYLETVTIRLNKKKTQQVLVQLLNPHFADGIRIYFDPFASKTAGISVGPVKLAGGNAKSYYVMKEGERVATYLHKSQYKKQFDKFFGDCSALASSGNPKWADLANHAYLYATECAR